VSLTVGKPLGKAAEYRVTISGTTSRKTKAGEVVEVYVAIPDVLLVPGLDKRLDCNPACAFTNDFRQGATMMRTRFELKPSWTAADAGTSAFDAEVGIPTGIIAARSDPAADVLHLPGISCSKIACRGSVPVVMVTSGTPMAAGSMARVNYGDPALGGYQWDSPLSPYTEADIGLTFKYPLTEELEIGYATRYSADGSNIGEEKQESIDTFLAGAVVGVSGALLLGAVQDAVAVSRERFASHD
jgi:hypothetical protein